MMELTREQACKGPCQVQRYMIRCEIIVAWQFYFDTDFNKNIT